MMMMANQKPTIAGQISMFEIMGQYQYANEREELLAEALKTGSGFTNGKEQLAEAVRLGVYDLAEVMKREYRTGGHSFNKYNAFIDYGSYGIKIKIWGNEKRLPREEKYTWTQAANMLTKLVFSGDY